jgi:hypothetical protein
MISTLGIILLIIIIFGSTKVLIHFELPLWFGKIFYVIISFLFVYYAISRSKPYESQTLGVSGWITIVIAGAVISTISIKVFNDLTKEKSFKINN